MRHVGFWLLLLLVACHSSPQEPETRAELTAPPPRLSRPQTRRHLPRKPLVGAPAPKGSECARRDGSWACSTPPLRAAKLTAPLSSWNVAKWEIDGQNVTGCASDNNTCTSASCSSGGVGPCLTLAEVQGRLGPNPAPSIDVTFDLVSSLGATDAIYLAFQGVGVPIFTGQLKQVDTATVGTVTPRSRGANSWTGVTVLGTPWKLSASGAPSAFWTPYVGMMVHDVTANAWMAVHADDGGGVGEFSEPLAPMDLAFNNYPPAYVTPQAGDSLVIYAMPTAPLKRLDSIAFNRPEVYHVGLAGVDEGLGYGLAVVLTAAEIDLIESRIETTLQGWNANPSAGISLVNSIGLGTPFFPAWLDMLGGEMNDGGSEVQLYDGSILDGDVLFQPRVHVQHATLYLGRAELGAGVDGHMQRDADIVLSPTWGGAYNDAVVWTLNQAGNQGGVLYVVPGSSIYVDPPLTYMGSVIMSLAVFGPGAGFAGGSALFPINQTTGLPFNGCASAGVGLGQRCADAARADAGIPGQPFCLTTTLQARACFE